MVLAIALANGCHGDDQAMGKPPHPGPYDCSPTSGPGWVMLDGAQQFDELQSALDAASPGSELRLCPGTYEGNFVAAVPVRLVAVDDHAVTVLSGLSDFAPTLTVRGDSEIMGLTIRSGGGGVRMSSSGSLRIQGSRLTGNRAEHGAGLIVAEGSTATLVDTSITENIAHTGGGGVWVRPGAMLVLTEGSMLSANRAGEFGGGVWLQDANLVGGLVTDNVLVWSSDSMPRRDADGDVTIDGEAFGGSGVALSGTGGVTGTEIAWNLGVGGALSVSRGTGTFVDTWVHDNDGRSPLVLGVGGGLVVASGTVFNEGTTNFEHNSAGFGGGAYILGGSVTGGAFTGNTADTGGGAVLLDGSISGATFVDNLASRSAGGLSVSGGELANVVIRGNTAGANSGGGLQATGSVRLEGVTIEDNHSTEHGGGIHATAHNEATLEIVDSSIIGNHADAGGGIYVHSQLWPLTLTLTDSIIAGNFAASTGGGLYIKDSVVVSGGGITGNVATAGGGAYVDTEGSLAVTATDFGVDPDENAPDDVATGSAAYLAYGANTNIACDDAVCVPAP